MYKKLQKNGLGRNLMCKIAQGTIRKSAPGYRKYAYAVVDLALIPPLKGITSTAVFQFPSTGNMPFCKCN